MTTSCDSVFKCVPRARCFSDDAGLNILNILIINGLCSGFNIAEKLRFRDLVLPFPFQKDDLCISVKAFSYILRYKRFK